jgi:DNA invertase Pin-like site-specific DNA recombinase
MFQCIENSIYFIYLQIKEPIMLVGYSRVSTGEQNLNLQTDALKAEGCEKFYSDVASGSSVERKGLNEAIEYVRKGDVLVVWKLDRLGRSLKHIIELVSFLETKGVGLKFIQEKIDTTGSAGKFYLQIFGALAEFERNIIRERTKAGLASARARGRLGGRPQKLSKDKIEMVKKLYDSKGHTVQEIADLVGISRVSVYAYLRKNS